ncbi:hypothetical protein MMC31_001175 [Peltigera leucophlebia]|nr:hypothetical protein [Peltigera leucophlebia]
MQQENKSPECEATYLSQPFNIFTQYPDSFDEFIDSRVGNVRIAELPSRIKEKHLKIWGGIQVNMDLLTTPLSRSIKVAELLYNLRPYVNAQPSGLQEKADMHHAFVALVDLWSRFDEILESWAKTEIGPRADAADGLFLLEQARFLPVLTRFGEAMQGYEGQPHFIKEVEEFVTTSGKLSQRIEVWLELQNT